MELKALLILIVFLVIYVALGGIVFHFLESVQEYKTRNDSAIYERDLLANYTCLEREQLRDLIQKVIAAYKDGVVFGNNTGQSPNWDYQSAMFFSTTVITTIGYGNMSPSTLGGRIFCVVYAIFGIPLFLITAGAIGSGLSRVGRRSRHDDRLPPEWQRGRGKAYQVLRAVLFGVLGVALFILVPAAIFLQLEDWTYAECLYYAFITLTTIGFGDYVIDTQKKGNYTGWYRLCVAGWIMLGLAWMAACLTSVQEIYSEAVRRREEQDRVSSLAGRGTLQASQARGSLAGAGTSMRSGSLAGAGTSIRSGSLAGAGTSIRSGSLSSWSQPNPPRTPIELFPPPLGGSTNKAFARLDSIEEGPGKGGGKGKGGAAKAGPSTLPTAAAGSSSSSPGVVAPNGSVLTSSGRSRKSSESGRKSLGEGSTTGRPKASTKL